MFSQAELCYGSEKGYLKTKMQTNKQINKQIIKQISAISLAIALSVGCQPVSSPLTLELRWQGQPLMCQQTIEWQGHKLQLEQLQVYLSDFKQQATLALKPSATSTDRLVLLGTDCASADQWQIVFAEPPVSGPMQFTLGVPADLNHQNPLTAPSVLQAADMHWSWQAGYKFLRLDWQGELPWSFHLGSTGCASASVMRAPTKACQAPNQVPITVNYQPNQPLVLDLGVLLQGVVPTHDNSCMADPLMPTCQQLFRNLGLDGAAPSTIFELGAGR